MQTLITLLMLSVSNLSHALTCEGSLNGVALDPTTGDVLVGYISLTKVEDAPVSGQTMWWPRFCSVVNAVNGIPAEGCKSLYATFLSAQATSRTVTLWIRGSATSCTAAYSQWDYIPGFYFMRIN